MSDPTLLLTDEDRDAMYPWFVNFWDGQPYRDDDADLMRAVEHIVQRHRAAERAACIAELEGLADEFVGQIRSYESGGGLYATGQRDAWDSAAAFLRGTIERLREGQG